MKKVINIDNISVVDEEKEKVRLLLENNQGQILLCNYNGIYMLPGGKVDSNELLEDALKREIKEELGIDLKKYDNLVTIDHYQKDYPKLDGSLLNRKVKTHYYAVKAEVSLDRKNQNLTDREKNNKFQLEWINKKDILRFIKYYKTNNPRDRFFKDELLYVLELYQNNKLIDMHTHTVYSDGELTPQELITYAFKRNINVLAITDHDTLNGIKTIDKNDPLIINSGIKIINGIELSAKANKGRMHILGYDIDIDNKQLNEKMKELRTNSYYSVLSLINQIKKDYNIMFDAEDIKDIFSSIGNIGRPHIARLLMKYKYAKDVDEAFDKYLIKAYEKTRFSNKGISYQECIKLIKDAGGFAILAHPNQLKMNDKELEDTLQNMINCGLDGIEIYHSGHSKEEIKKYLLLAERYNLLISGGSDYHGINIKPNIELGTGFNNNLKIKKLSLVDCIDKRIH